MSIDSEQLITNQGAYTGASQFHQGTIAGALLFHSGMIHGADLLAKSADPMKLLADLKAGVTTGHSAPDNGIG
jgi:hypothetical protein